MIYGDGMNKTTVSASKNVADGMATYLTATLSSLAYLLPIITSIFSYKHS